MTEQTKMNLKRDLNEEVNRRRKFNEELNEEDAVKVIEEIIEMMNKINNFPKRYVPALIISWTEGEVGLSKQNNQFLDGLKMEELMSPLKCTLNCWEKVKEFLDETLGSQNAESQYVIEFF